MRTSYNEKEDVRKAQQGDQKSLEAILLKNQKLIYALLKRYRYPREEKEDLLSCCNIALIKAVQQFNFDYDVEFSTYAVPLILGEIKKYFRDNRLIRVSRSTKELYGRMMKKQEEMECNLERSVSLEELASAMEVSKEDVLEAIEANFKPTSLQTSISDEEDLSLLDTIGYEDPFIERIELREACQQLSKKEQLFIDLRFYQGLNQKEIAERFFVSQVQVSRLEKKILSKLKAYI